MFYTPQARPTTINDTLIGLPNAKANVILVATPIENSAWLDDIVNLPTAIKVESELDNIYTKYQGLPQRYEEFNELIKKYPNFDINLVDVNGLTLIDYAIETNSELMFLCLYRSPKITIESLFHALNFLNEKIARLPKNKSRPRMKLALLKFLKEEKQIII